jgi:hypothetical protein
MTARLCRLRTFELARAFERIEKITKGIERHDVRLAERPRHAMAGEDGVLIWGIINNVAQKFPWKSGISPL